VQREYRRVHNKVPPHKKGIIRWDRQLKETGRSENGESETQLTSACVARAGLSFGCLQGHKGSPHQIEINK
jgi:hypothetical protein